MEEHLYNAAVKYQQICYELCSDYHVFKRNNSDEIDTYLKQFIANTLYGIQTSDYDEQKRDTINTLYNKIINCSCTGMCNIYCGVIFNMVFLDKSKFEVNCIYPIPIFRVRNCIECNTAMNSTAPVTVTYIDIGGRVYKDWNEYIEKNTLCDMIMVSPRNGCYTIHSSMQSGRFYSSVWTEKHQFPNKNTASRLFEHKSIENDMLSISGGVSILLGGIWRNECADDSAIKQVLQHYIVVDKIVLHGIPHYFEPPTMYDNYMNCGQLFDINMDMINSYITYLGNCRIPANVLRDVLKPYFPDMLRDLEALLRENRHTLEHKRTIQYALFGINKDQIKNGTIIREVKRISNPNDLLNDLVLDNDVINNIELLDPIEIATTVNKISTNVTVQDTVNISLATEDQSVKTYVTLALEYMRDAIGIFKQIPPDLLMKFISLARGTSSIGISTDVFIILLHIVDKIITSKDMEDLQITIEELFFNGLQFIWTYIIENAYHLSMVVTTNADIAAIVTRVVHMISPIIRPKIKDFVSAIKQYISTCLT